MWYLGVNQHLSPHLPTTFADYVLCFGYLCQCTDAYWIAYSEPVVGKINYIGITFCEKCRQQVHMQVCKFKVCRSVLHHTMQINQPTRCKNFSSLLLDVYIQLNMFRASSRPLSGAVFRGLAGRSDHNQQHCYHHAPTVSPETDTAVVELLMMGVRTPETCWAVHEHQVINLRNFCIWLVDLFEKQVCKFTVLWTS